jgi:asparagine synthase (glutamine-hydrolysing)
MASGAVPRRLDRNALWHYLSLRSMPDECSLIDGVHKLQAANTLLIKADGTSRLRRYWDPEFVPKLKLSDHDAADALDQCLREAVTTHLLSDVPVGTFLSGGIDSTTIGAMMARASDKPVPAFCIGVVEVGFDELPIAQQVATAEKMDFHGVRVESDLTSLLPLMISHLGEPADPYAVGMYLASRLAAGHVKVALSGDGGDESFGGYDRYLGQRLVDYYCAIPRVLRHRVLPRLIASVPETYQYKSLAQRLSWLQGMADLDGGERYAQALGFLRFTPELRDELFHPDVIQSIDDRNTAAKVLRYYDSPSLESMTDRMLYTDLMTRVPDHNLVMSDRMSMACSLEVRSPFVDKQVVEFAASLPARMKIRGFKLKYLLRRVARRYLPATVTRRSKQGFGFPVGMWLRQDLRGLVEHRLCNSHFVEAGIFEQEPIERLLREHMSGLADHNYRLWLLLNLELWHEIYIEGRSVDAVREDILQLAREPDQKARRHALPAGSEH